MMDRFKSLFKQLTNWNRTDRLKSQLKDYVDVTFSSFASRQLTYIAALLISAYYFDPVIAVICIAAVELTEIFDLLVARKIRSWSDDSPQKARRWLILTMLSTLFSAVAVAAFILSIAIQQKSGGHFTPLFFLVAGSLFAAMNNHQIPAALALRLTIYGLAFLFIAFLDVVRFNPPLASPVWLEFFTTLFAMFFIVSNSLVFFRLYRSLKSQMEKLEHEHQRTKIAYEAKAQFVSTLSHELRTPLTTINGALGLANSGKVGKLPDSLAQLFEVAEKSGTRLSALINDLFDVQKLEAHELKLQFEILNLGELVAASSEAYKQEAEKSGINIKLNLPAQEIWVRADYSRLTQVMTCLLSNAVKYSSEGSDVEVGLRQTGQIVAISVTDSGTGIPEGSQDKVFGYFGQVDSTDRRQIGGSGLGMYISKMIVEMHNGKIYYSSELGKGTVFVVELDFVDHSQN